MTLHHESMRDHACLIVHGPDKAGLVAAVTALITRNQGNIVTLDQYSDNPQGGAFFQRVVFNRPNLTAAIPEIEQDLAEARIVELLKGNVDFVVLARYMQILSDTFLEEVDVPVINIHHSFLPAFIGAEIGRA